MTSKRMRVAVGVALVGLVVAVTPAVSGAGTIGTAGQATTFVPSPNIAVAEALPLPGGAIAVRTEGGSLVVGPANLSLATAVGDNGLQAVVGAPDPVPGLGTTADGWTEDVIVRFMDEVKSGHTLREAAALVEGDRLLAATNGPADPADDVPTVVCQDSANTRAAARQCLTRRRGDDDGTNRYIGDASWTYVEPDEYFAVVDLTQKHTYSKIQTIVQFSPTTTVGMGSCGTYTVGIAGHGADISYSKQICPERMSPDLDTKTESFGVDWDGYRSGSVYVEMADMVQLPSASPSLIYFSFTAEVIPNCLQYLLCFIHS